MSLLLLGIAGKIGSGKTTVAEILENKYNFCKMSCSDVLIDLLLEKYDDYDFTPRLRWSNKNIERDNLIKFGRKLKEMYGDGLLVELAIHKLRKKKCKNIVIDGIRTLKEVEMIQKHGGKIVFIHTDPHVRFQRILLRNHKKDSKICTIEDLLEFDRKEEQEYDIAEIEEIADYIIDNNDSIDRLERRIRKVIYCITPSKRMRKF